MKILFILSCFFLTACASKAIISSEDVKVSRDNPPLWCKPIDKVVGRVMTLQQTREDALKDLKQSAANKGANYVQTAQVSDHGTSITGQAFNCHK